MGPLILLLAGTAEETTIIRDLTPGENYTVQLVATRNGDCDIMPIRVHIPAHFGSCYVHFINKGLQLLENGALWLHFSSVGPVSGYMCGLDR